MAESQEVVEKQEQEQQEQEQQEETKKTTNPNDFKKMAKSMFSRAKLSRYLGLMFVIIATVVLSLWQCGWDPAKIGWEKFTANTALLLFLGIYGLFFGENEGQNLFRNLITGIYQATLKKFNDVVKTIKSKAYIDALPDYIVWRYQKEYENTCHMKMLSVRLFDKEILDLTDEQLETLRRQPLQIDENTYYSQISEDQYKVIKDIKEGKVFVDYIDDYNFYLVTENTDGKQLVTRVKETNKRKEKISWQQRLSRIVIILLGAIIFAGFFFEIAQVIDPSTMTPEEIAAAELAAKQARIQTAKDLTSRITCLVVSIASGFNTARLLNLEDVFVIKYKEAYDSVFVGCMDNKTFVPIDYKAKAKREFEKYQKEQEEAKAKVVTPEVVVEKQPEVTMIEDKTIYGGYGNDTPSGKVAGDSK